MTLSLSLYISLSLSLSLCLSVCLSVSMSLNLSLWALHHEIANQKIFIKHAENDSDIQKHIIWAKSGDSHHRIASESCRRDSNHQRSLAIISPFNKHRVWSSQTLRSLHCGSHHAIGVHWCSIRSTWTSGMACESWPSLCHQRRF